LNKIGLNKIPLNIKIPGNADINVCFEVFAANKLIEVPAATPSFKLL